ncbi:hypothetical protein GCM10025865_24860 [Paraoerskovia sediminicola]|uniref:ComEC/Rec2-related protein domain-containing protein n=1 Tax=Paraoerskovia sediminicola TaxID=1138587 RepID=A0ABN6XHK2_9CELL|nr:ComEC/Rec2 family competence protein [Paraoerskovia sediminicola]BDZ43187.1 hypothetical protein GCM10025865_24860 [Paraoerskovia sediminicola]
MTTTTDLRLVPSAVVAWICAWVGTRTGPASMPRWPVTVLLAVLLLVVAVGLVSASRRRARASGSSATRRPAALVGGQVLLVLAVAGAVLAVVGVRADLGEAGGVAELASTGATGCVIGTVVADPVPATTFGSKPEGVRTALRVHGVSARGVVKRGAGTVDVVGGPEWSEIAVGAVVIADGRFGTAHPGAEEVAGFVPRGPPQVVEPPGAVLGAVARVRGAMMEVTAGLSPQARGLVPGAAIGDTTRVPEEIEAAMLATSLTHVTAVSGGHFAVVVAAIGWCCSTARAPRWVRVVVTGAAVVGFVLLVRPDPSVLRAAATGCVGLVGTALGRPARAVPALAACVVVLLVVDPWLARSFGFVLSVAATAGLVTLTGPIASRLTPWCGRQPAFLVAVPIAAQVACGPVLVLLDPSLAIYAVPANLLAALALAPATVLGVMAALVAPWWGGAAWVLAWCAGLATWWIAAVATFFARLPAAALPWVPGVGGAVLLAALTAAALAVLRWGWPVAR